jgi:ribosomal protein S18 acetylase RimI-like enzyme
MTITIRPARESDEEALSKICLLTADAGQSAEHLHDYKELPGLIFAVPYVKLPTTWGFVMDDDSKPTGENVVGYILGSKDTREFERYASEHWWPNLAKEYPVTKAKKEADVKYTKLLENMFTAADRSIEFSPAHLHIDILPEYQKQGWGRKLIQTAADYLKEEGLPGVWLGIDLRNESAAAFYQKLGFHLIPGANPGNYGLSFK